MADTMGKLKRSALLHYLDTTFGGETPVWFVITAMSLPQM